MVIFCILRGVLKPYWIIMPFYLDIKVQFLAISLHFTNKKKDYPSIFAFMIGNELNIDYIDQQQFLMSLVNGILLMQTSTISIQLTNLSN